MIQDIEPKIFYNAFAKKAIESQSKVILFFGRNVLIRQDKDNTLHLPAYGELSVENDAAVLEETKRYQYIFSIDNEEYFLKKSFGKEERFGTIEGYHWENISKLRQI